MPRGNQYRIPTKMKINTRTAKLRKLILDNPQSSYAEISRLAKERHNMVAGNHTINFERQAMRASGIPVPTLPRGPKKGSVTPTPHVKPEKKPRELTKREQETLAIRNAIMENRLLTAPQLKVLLAEQGVHAREMRINENRRRLRELGHAIPRPNTITKDKFANYRIGVSTLQKDTDARNAFYSTITPDVLSIIKKFSKGRIDEELHTNKALSKIERGIARLPTETTPKDLGNFVRITAARTAFDAVNKEKTRKQLIENAATLSKKETLKRAWASSRKKDDHLEEVVEFENAMEMLSPKLKEAILEYLHGSDYQEIADAKNIPIGTVKSRISLARRALEERLR